jgi:phosphoribosyl 1,2-cyclic phosphate phosphodiesterase
MLSCSPGSPYPPILDLRTIDGPVTVPARRGAIAFTPFRADHGSMDALGFRIGGLAYLPDAVDIPEESWPVLEGLDCWIVDACAANRTRPMPILT